jgi:FMN phosphatase YigB (HAD superfamily)
LWASSAGCGIAKPAPAFFAKVQQVAKVPASAIAYVGDRLDYDIIPARAAGMTSVFIQRGSWARAHAKRRDIAFANLVIRSLAELPTALLRLNNDRPEG